MCIWITAEFGLVIRKRALLERNISMDMVLGAMEVSSPLDCNDELISFGPSFGQEALDEFVRRLTELGFEYFDDFFEFSFPSPSWCQFHARLSPAARGREETGNKLPPTVSLDMPKGGK